MAKIKFAAAVMLLRGPHNEPEVYLARRAPEIRFFGDYWVFPGGNLSIIDRITEEDPANLVLARCAIREAFEEINTLATTGQTFDPQQKQLLRQALLEEPAVWQNFIQAINPDDYLTPVYRITTPPFAPVLFDTQFYLARADQDESPAVDGYELVEGRFVKPSEVVNDWLHGKMRIAPPVLYLLQLLADGGIENLVQQAKQASQRLDQGELHPVYFSPGIFMAPLSTQTIPPATTTNTLVVGTQILYIVDPATTEPDEQQRLFDWLDKAISRGAKLEAILLTHHHPDHVGSVNALSLRYGLPVRAHADCCPRIPSGYHPGEPLKNGDQLELGSAPDGSPNWQLQVIHTPGHTTDHLCFMESRYKAAIVGDMISTISTILINPPEGHMRTYLDSLQRLLDCSISTLYPAHGPAYRDGSEIIRHFIQHREDREQATIKALSETPQQLDDLLPVVYKDTPKSVYPIARRSLLAHLTKLEEDGVSLNTPNGWHLA